MTVIIGALTPTIANGQVADATVVMAMLAFIQTQVNSNACPKTIGSSILKGDGAGGTASAVAGTDFASPGANTDITSLLAAAGVAAATQAIGDSSTKLATTQFVNPSFLLAASPFVKLASGHILQWGSGTTSNAGDVSVALPVAFPTAFVGAGGTGVNAAGSVSTTIGVGSNTLSAVQFGGWQFPGGVATRVVTAFFWWAIGY